MRTARETAAAVVAGGGEARLGRLIGVDADIEGRVAAALDEYARAYHAERLREALGAEGPVSDPRFLKAARGWVAGRFPDHQYATATIGEFRDLLAALDHFRDLACAMRHDNGYRDGWEAGLAEGLRRAKQAPPSG